MKGILVGMGGRGRSWIQVCKRNADVKLVAFVEPAEAQRKAVAEQFEIPADRTFVSLADALKATQADFALDVTPPAAHEAVALEAFSAGLHVLGEKPLSDEFSAARRIVAAAGQAGRTHMVTQNYRFGPVPRTTRRLLSEGAVGDPAQVTVGFYRAWATRLGTHYTTMPYPLLTDMGIHHFDLLRYVMGQEPVRVSARSWNPGWGWHAGDASHTAFIEFTGGLVATHHSCGCSVGKQSPWNGDWRIDGPEGSLTWEEDQIFVTREHPPEQKRREAVPADPLSLAGQDALLSEFVAAVKEGREPECSGRDNLRSLALTFATVQSAREGRPVEIGELLA
ncbi:MAG: Gfo/Idh/MocA family oxidoreductase [Candidatus Latescibacteria bacterium]|nr:Gfo/Idh/MocA family oxidoreductase [Candidatus Latescibacterota bacterium]